MKTNAKKTLTAVLLSLAFLTAAAGSGSSTDQNTANKVGEVSSSSSKTDDKDSKDKPSTDEESSKKEPTENKSEYKVGESFETNDLKFVYVSSGEYESDNTFTQPKDGYKYVFIELYCENISKSDTSISEFCFDCFADGYSCDSFYGGDTSFGGTMSPGRYVEGKIFFEVPNDAENIEIEYETNFFTSKKVKFIYEGNKKSDFVPEGNVSASENAFKVGDIVETDALRITYLSCTEYESDNMFITPKDGNHFIYFEFEFENISTSDKLISTYDFDCFADGKSCDTAYRDDALSATISAGRKTKGTVAFEVPNDAKIIEAEYETSFFSSKRVLFSFE